jgi:hypothetical protein
MIATVSMVSAAVLMVISVGASSASATAVHSQSSVAITMDPVLSPVYSPTISDYILTCPKNRAVHVWVSAPSKVEVSVADHKARTGSFSTHVVASAGQEFTIAVTHGHQSSLAYIRCVPSDFPAITPMTRDAGNRRPGAEFYVVLPFGVDSLGAPPYLNHYVIVLDDNGVPVWWANTTTPTATGVFGTMLANGDVAWTYNNNEPAQEVSLDGQPVRTISGSNGTVDLHELRLLPNGNYLITLDTEKSGINLSAAWCTTTPTACPLTSVTIFDPIIEEVTPAGNVVWEWDASTNVPITETDVVHRAAVVAQDIGGNLGAVSGVYDPYHVNAASGISDSNDFLVSLPCMDAIYRITPSLDGSSTGTVDWKLGGLPDGKNLVIRNDPDAPNTLGFQHDVTDNANGTVTVYDDGIGFSRAPRDLEFRINTKKSPGTATLVQSESYAPISGGIICCGSANKLPGGDWLNSWGAFTNAVTELTPGTDPKLVWGVDLPLGDITYRAVPVLRGAVTVAQLRAGMDTQYGAPGS